MQKYTASGEYITQPNGTIDFNEILNHKHKFDLEQQVNVGLYTGLPDFSRAVKIDYTGRVDTDTIFAAKIHIYKINVPGYIYVGSNGGSYNQDIDYVIFLADDPIYFFNYSKKTISDATYSDQLYNYRLLYSTEATDASTDLHPRIIPIIPGDHTYFYIADCTDSKFHTRPVGIYFVPSYGQPATSDFITLVGYCRQCLNTYLSGPLENLTSIFNRTGTSLNSKNIEPKLIPSYILNITEKSTNKVIANNVVLFTSYNDNDNAFSSCKQRRMKYLNTNATYRLVIMSTKLYLVKDPTSNNSVHLSTIDFNDEYRYDLSKYNWSTSIYNITITKEFEFDINKNVDAYPDLYILSN